VSRGKRSTMTQRRVRGRFQMIENSPLNAIIDFAFVLKRSREFKKGSFSMKRGELLRNLGKHGVK